MLVLGALGGARVLLLDELLLGRQRRSERAAELRAAGLRQHRIGASLAAIEQRAFTLDHVAEQTHLLLALFALLGALLFTLGHLAALGSAAFHVLQHFFQLGELLAFLVQTTIAGSVAHLFGEALHIFGVKSMVVGVVFVGIRIAAGLIGERLQMALQGVLQVLGQLFDLGGIDLLVALFGVEGRLQGFVGPVEIARGALWRAVFEVQDQRPNARLGLIHHPVVTPAQQGRDRAQIQKAGAVVAPDIIETSEAIEFRQRRPTPIGVEHQQFPDRHQGARHRMLERSFGQREHHVGGRADQSGH